MWDEEGRDGEHRVVPSEPDLVGPISRADKASARHFKAVEGGLVSGDVSQKVLYL